MPHLKTVVAALALLAGGCLCSEKPAPPAPSPAPAPVAPAPEPTPPPAAPAPAEPEPAAPAPDMVTIELATRPAGAQLTLDGAPLGKSPVTVTRAASAVAHRLVAALDGYATLERSVQYPGSRRITLTLRPVSKGAVAAPAQENDYQLEDLKDPYAK